MTEPAGTAPRRAANGALEAQIIEAAYACFERFGITKTTMEDIARGASVSRQSVYRYFARKDDILDEICAREAVKINAIVRARIRRDGNFADTLTDALCVIISEADKNPYLRQVIDAPSVQTLASSPASRAYRLNRSYWQGMMQRAAAAGQLADDLSLDEIVSWLLMMQSVLQLRLASGQIDAAQLHRLVRRFAVAPLLKSV